MSNLIRHEDETTSINQTYGLSVGLSDGGCGEKWNKKCELLPFACLSSLWTLPELHIWVRLCTNDTHLSSAVEDKEVKVTEVNQEIGGQLTRGSIELTVTMMATSNYKSILNERKVIVIRVRWIICLIMNNGIVQAEHTHGLRVGLSDGGWWE